MHKCGHEQPKKDFCYECVREIQGLQAKAVEQLSNRFQYIWRRADKSFKDLMVKSEIKYPIASAQILSTVPVEGTSLKDYIKALITTYKVMTELKKEYAKAYFQFYEGSFIIYQNINETLRKKEEKDAQDSISSNY